MGRHVILIAAIALLATTATFAQTGSPTSLGNADFWVDHWSHPPVIVFGPQEDDFYKNVQAILFPWNDHDEPSNPSALDSDIQWLKDHPNVRFYVDGYASTRGDDVIYNLRLSQRRANWVKQTLVSRGIPEDRIKVAAGWGQQYPVCHEQNDECWSKNRLVRLVYSPN
jgi:outer membrane protein OmpA-like peptidoglycan-associated protein